MKYLGWIDLVSTRETLVENGAFAVWANSFAATHKVVQQRRKSRLRAYGASMDFHSEGHQISETARMHSYNGY